MARRSRAMALASRRPSFVGRIAQCVARRFQTECFKSGRAIASIRDGPRGARSRFCARGDRPEESLRGSVSSVRWRQHCHRSTGLMGECRRGACQFHRNLLHHFGWRRARNSAAHMCCVDVSRCMWRVHICSAMTCWIRYRGTLKTQATEAVAWHGRAWPPISGSERARCDVCPLSRAEHSAGPARARGL